VPAVPGYDGALVMAALAGAAMMWMRRL